MIHRRMEHAILIATLGGFAGGYVASHYLLIGAVVAAIAAIFAIWYTPHAETVAIQWREHQRLQERESS